VPAAVDLREAADIKFVRQRTGMAHVDDPQARQAWLDGSAVFDVDLHCRKLEAWMERNDVPGGFVCEELLPGGRPVYYTAVRRRSKPKPPLPPAVAMRVRRK
jgi:hypothetical protein